MTDYEWTEMSEHARQQFAAPRGDAELRERDVREAICRQLAGLSAEVIVRASVGKLDHPAEFIDTTADRILALLATPVSREDQGTEGQGTAAVEEMRDGEAHGDECACVDCKQAAELWVGFDFDGTLAEYDQWRGASHCGAPIPAMVRLVRDTIEAGVGAKIVTARVARADQADEARAAIEAWCEEHIGARLEVTCRKDYGMLALYDDRAVAVEHNTGRILATPTPSPTNAPSPAASPGESGEPERFEGYARYDVGGVWDFEADDGRFKPAPNQIPATLIIRPAAPGQEEKR